jgi:hypothetical protein
MSKEDIARDIIERHELTINWDAGCIVTLEKNIVVGLENYHQEQLKLLNIDNVSKSFYCSTKRGCLEQCDDCALTELSTPC